MAFLSIPAIHSLKSSRCPIAYIPATMEPNDVPATEVMLNPCAMSESIAPICAIPRAPPLERTRATSRRSLLKIFARIFLEPTIAIIISALMNQISPPSFFFHKTKININNGIAKKISDFS